MFEQFLIWLYGLAMGQNFWRIFVEPALSWYLFKERLKLVFTRAPGFHSHFLVMFGRT